MEFELNLGLIVISLVIITSLIILEMSREKSK